MFTPSPWKYFSIEELTCRCGCGQMKMFPEFMEKLLELRGRWYGKSMKVTSGYRCPAHNNRVSSTGSSGPHTTGRAVDIQISGERAFELVGDIYRMGGFYGVGLKQEGDSASRIIHIDDLTDHLEHGEFPRPRVWSY